MITFEQALQAASKATKCDGWERTERAYWTEALSLGSCTWLLRRFHACGTVTLRETRLGMVIELHNGNPDTTNYYCREGVVDYLTVSAILQSPVVDGVCKSFLRELCSPKKGGGLFNKIAWSAR